MVNINNKKLIIDMQDNFGGPLSYVDNIGVSVPIRWALPVSVHPADALKTYHLYSPASPTRTSGFISSLAFSYSALTNS